MTEVENIKSICEQYGIKPSKSKGQNFLIDKNIVQKIVREAGIAAKDVVLEVGPGLGVLTEELLKSAKKVVSVELDAKAAAYLRIKFKSELANGKFQLIEEDILRANLPAIGLKDFEFKIVANLPYSITSKFFRQFLEYGPKPIEMTVMIQKEVAERLSAEVGDMSLLALSAQFFARPKILFTVAPSCFWPQPEVESAVVKLMLSKELPAVDAKQMFKLAKLGFGSKRKQLHNNLAGGLGLGSEAIKEVFRKHGWREDVRAQDLNVDDWVSLAQELNDL